MRHLLTHTSGIPDYEGSDALDFRRDYTEEELAKLAFGLKPEFPPGARWNYSNTGYVLLGIIVGKASGRFYGDLLAERVFAPLGMKTARIISEEDIVPNRAAGYRLVDGELKNQEWVAPRLNTTADGSLYLSVLDLVAWDRGLRAGAVLKAPELGRGLHAGRASTAGRPTRTASGGCSRRGPARRCTATAGPGRASSPRSSGSSGATSRSSSSPTSPRPIPSGSPEGIAALLEPKLAKPELVPIADTEPQVTARLRELLAAAAKGDLRPEDFAYVRAGFFPSGAKGLETTLASVGPPTTVSPLRRIDLGDDRVHIYDVSYASQAFRVVLALAPDGKVSLLSVRPR